LRLILTLTAQHILDENVRARWFRARDGRELTRLAGRFDTPARHAEDNVPGGELTLSEIETSLLRLVTEGRTNREIAAELGTTDEAVSRQLLEIFAKIGASTRAEATATALMGRLV
jgi:DNA-binding NarL/FixJ family response regulator